MPCLVIFNIYHVMSVCHVTSWYAMSYGLVCGDPPSVLKPQATNREQLNWKICGHEHPIEDIFAFSEQPELVSFPCGRFPRLSPQHPQRGAIAVKRRQVQQGTAWANPEELNIWWLVFICCTTVPQCHLVLTHPHLSTECLYLYNWGWTNTRRRMAREHKRYVVSWRCFDHDSDDQQKGVIEMTCSILSRWKTNKKCKKQTATEKNIHEQA